MNQIGRMPLILQGTIAVVVIMTAVAIIFIAVPWALKMVAAPADEVDNVVPSYGQELQLEIKGINKYGDTAPTTGNVYVYALDGRLLDNDNATAGIWTSTGKYEPGTFVNLKVEPTNFQTIWVLNHEVERAKTAELTTDYDTVEVVYSPTLAVKAENPAGTQITSAGEYSRSTSSKPTMTFTVRNTLDDSGWIDTYDPHLAMDYKVVFYIRLQNATENEQGLEESGGVGFDSVIITAPLAVRSWASKTTYYGNVPSNSMVRDIAVDKTVLSSGIWSLQVTFDMTGWTDNNVRVDYGVNTYTSAAYYTSYGAWGDLASETEDNFYLVS